LAVNHTWFDKQTQQKKEEVTFVDVTLWGRQAEIAGEYLAKGRSVLIEGRLRLDTWDDKESGQKRSKLKVVCENMTMVGGRGEGAPGGGGGAAGGGGQFQQRSAPSGGRPQGQPQSPPQFDSDRSPADSFYDDQPSGGGGGGGGAPTDEVPF